MTLRLASLEQDGWELDSGVARHEESPDSFWIPSESARSNLKRGQAAKLIFLVQRDGPDGEPIVEGERMWVMVLGKEGGQYRGFLDNIPVTTTLLEIGDEVCFGPEHIIDIADPPDDHFQERTKRFVH